MFFGNLWQMFFERITYIINQSSKWSFELKKRHKERSIINHYKNPRHYIIFLYGKFVQLRADIHTKILVDVLDPKNLHGLKGKFWRTMVRWPVFGKHCLRQTLSVRVFTIIWKASELSDTVVKAASKLMRIFSNASSISSGLNDIAASLAFAVPASSCFLMSAPASI